MLCNKDAKKASMISLQCLVNTTDSGHLSQAWVMQISFLMLDNKHCFSNMHRSELREDQNKGAQFEEVQTSKGQK